MLFWIILIIVFIILCSYKEYRVQREEFFKDHDNKSEIKKFDNSIRSEASGGLKAFNSEIRDGLKSLNLEIREGLNSLNSELKEYNHKSSLKLQALDILKDFRLSNIKAVEHFKNLAEYAETEAKMCKILNVKIEDFDSYEKLYSFSMNKYDSFVEAIVSPSQTKEREHSLLPVLKEKTFFTVDPNYRCIQDIELRTIVLEIVEERLKETKRELKHLLYFHNNGAKYIFDLILSDLKEKELFYHIVS